MLIFSLEFLSLFFLFLIGVVPRVGPCWVLRLPTTGGVLPACRLHCLIIIIIIKENTHYLSNSF